jgi:hypothetical protein
MLVQHRQMRDRGRTLCDSKSRLEKKTTTLLLYAELMAEIAHRVSLISETLISVSRWTRARIERLFCARHNAGHMPPPTHVNG